LSLSFCIDDKLGGVTSLNYNLLAHTPSTNLETHVISIDLTESIYSRANVNFPVTHQVNFAFSNKENYYSVLKRLRELIPNKAGALILNYDTEMAMLDNYEVDQTTYQLVHDDYNLLIAQQYEHVVDVFICHNTIIKQKLLSSLSHRAKSIFYLPHGVPVPGFFRNSKDDTTPIKLLFLGRMAENKGIFDLPVINNLLRERGVAFEWLCIGNGPQLDDLKKAWNPADRVEFFSPASNDEVLRLCASRDVFVLPTKFEGSPVSLLETMSVGLVPVITKIPGGVTDIVNKDIGFAIEMDDNRSFATAIKKLSDDRNLLERLSANCRRKIVEEFDVTITSQGYHALFQRYEEFYKEKKLKKLKVGARLDHQMIPNFVTRLIRTLLSS